MAPDQLAPGEIAESKEEAFGLVLPAGLRVTRREFNMVTAEGSVTPEEVSNYVRSRIKEGDVETGPGRTSFLRANVLKPATTWRGVLRIDVEGSGKYTQLRVFGEQTPKDIPPLPMANSIDLKSLGQPGEGQQRPPKM